MASKWSGILGSALKGAAEVAVPAALAKTADERRARLQQLRDQALFAQQRSLAADQFAFQRSEGDKSRTLQRDLGERNLGLIEAQMKQGADQFGQEFGFNQQKHQDQMRLQEEELKLMRQGRSQSLSGDMQLLQYFEQRLGKTPEEAVEMWQDTKNDPNAFVEKFVIEAMKAHGEFAPEPFDAEAAAMEGRQLYQTIRSRETTPAMSAGGEYSRENPAQPTTQEEFDALPSGAIFLDPEDGKLYRKP